MFQLIYLLGELTYQLFAIHRFYRQKTLNPFLWN